MKKAIRFIAVLGLLLCMCGFITSVYAENEVDLSSIETRLSNVEKLKENEIINHLMENEDKLTSHADFWMGVISAAVAASALLGAIIPLIMQIRNNIEYNKIKEELSRDSKRLDNELTKIKTYIDDAKKEMQAYTYFAMAKNEEDLNSQLKLYSTAIELNALYMQAYNNRGNVYHEMKKYEKAFSDYNKALEIEQNPYTYNNRGNLYIDILEYEKAIQEFNKAIEIDPNYAKAYFNRGRAYRRYKKLEKAVQDYNMAINLNQEEYMYYFHRAQLLKEMDDLKGFERDMNKYKELKDNMQNNEEEKTEA